jgi:hypothetical protein
MRSKKIFTDADRQRYSLFMRLEQVSEFDQRCYDALMIAEAEIEELREKLHNANVEISSLIDLRPEN